MPGPEDVDAEQQRLVGCRRRRQERAAGKEKQLFLENLEAPSMYNSRRNPRPEISARNMLLQNSDVRVVNMRMGALLAHNSPLVGALGWHADWGLLRHIGDG